MGSSVPIGKIFGINVRIDLTMLLLFAYFGYLGFADGGWHGAADRLTLLVFLFISIFLHEMGHAGAAAAFGISTHDVTLHFFGGYARLSEPPRRPLEEASIAVAGPIVNLAIALALYGLVRANAQSESSSFLDPYASILGTLAFANIVLGVFNMLPGFPLDGGSFVRAILSLWLSRPLARMIVGFLGVLVGIGLAVYGYMSGGLPLTMVLGALLALLAFGEATNARRAMVEQPRDR